MRVPHRVAHVSRPCGDKVGVRGPDASYARTHARFAKVAERKRAPG